jgi:pectate lyase
MHHSAKSIVVIGLLVLTQLCNAAEEERSLAFPGAQGFGAYAKGGRGGRVIFVTNLNADGPGSLQAACSAKGPRTVIFRTGGVIRTTKSIGIHNPYITIAGQTAPGDGICIRGAPLQLWNTHDVIVRGLRIRVGDAKDGPNPDGRDGIAMSGAARNVIIDHCSVSWGIDENVSTWPHQATSRDITIQWCIISEALNHSLHSKGRHGMGLLIGDHTKRISVHRNLFAHNDHRNPHIKGGTTSETVNNVVYNWGQHAVAFTDPEGSGPSLAHIVGNTFVPGPNSSRHVGCLWFHGTVKKGTRVFVNGNAVDGKRRLMSHKNDQRFVASEPVFESSNLSVEPADKAYKSVLEKAGALWPRRDPVDRRILEHVKNRKGTVINSQKAVGGWPKYDKGKPPKDSDGDGMPDAWEKKHGLDPKNPKDAARRVPPGASPGDRHAGYTWVEFYINQLVEPKNTP